MIAIALRILAVVLMGVCIILELVGVGGLVTLFRDGALLSFFASFLPLP